MMMLAMTRSIKPEAGVALCAAFCALLVIGCGDDPTGPTSNDAIPAGGVLTIVDGTSAAFSQPAPTLGAEDLERHAEGDAAFEATFVTAPAPRFGGLGPVFNNTSCTACHTGDGRGRAVTDGALGGRVTGTTLFRISMPGTSPFEAPLPVPGFGRQLQDRAVLGVAGEARVDVVYTERTERLADGIEVRLRVPTYNVSGAYTAFPSAALISPRTAPPVFGLGLLEAVSEADVLARADENDADGDGISGRPNYAIDPRTGARKLGRFGWKASAVDLIAQTAGAYNEDMGITSALLRTESCHDQQQETAAQNGGPEVDSATVEAVAHYMRTLGVPARREANDERVRRGRGLFVEARCAGCHTPEMRAGASPLALLSGQRFAPYTDLLLHDMGPELADNRPDFAATGTEWRTAPLWGIGLTRVVSGHTEFLHDGRARSMLEAIMWHGGEAARARELVRAMSAGDRGALLVFLASL